MKRSCPVAAAAERAPESIAYEWSGSALSFRAFDALVAQQAGSLSRLGVVAGSRVAVVAWNSLELAALFFACGRLGAAMVPLNARLTTTEIAAQRALCSPHVIVAGQEFSLPDAVSLDSLSRGDPSTAVEIEDDSVIAALFTSGTTGTPKLVELTHGNFLASALASASNLGAAASHRWLGTLPLFHVGGLSLLYRCAVAGARVVLERSFDVERAVQLFASGQLSHASLVPTTLERLLDAWGSRAAPAGLHAILVGGGPGGAALFARARAAGFPCVQTYGLTEACSQVATERLSEADGTTVGPPLEGISVRIVDEAGAPCAVGVAGEIQVSGATVARGRGPWLSTKDIGELDARGRLIIHARRVDVIITGGENVYPAEVEHVLAQHEAVRELAVVPQPDSHWGQLPIAVVVWRGEPVSLEALRAFGATKLAGYKLPRGLVTRDSLPRNAMGKIDRKALIDALP